MEALRKLYTNQKIIVGRDKLDPTKGVLPKVRRPRLAPRCSSPLTSFAISIQLRAFERFLHDYPQWAHKVVLIQVTSPSPGDSADIGTKVSELVDQINGQYGSLEFQPVHYYHQTIERDVRVVY